MHLSDLSLPENALDVLLNQGISSLYPPQEEAMKHVLKDENLVVCVPTASGKSLIAYLAIIRKLLQSGGKALYIVPLIALAKEKYEELKQFESIGLKIGISTGDLDDSNPRLSRYDVIVCTSEKADSMLRHGVQWIQDINVLVIDEIHLIHDPLRGPTLEVLIAHFQATNPHTQLIALSATIQNATELAIWLQAKLVTSDWRPVPLSEGVFYNNEITFDDGKTTPVESTRKQPLFSLIEQTLAQQGQVLVFVNTRKSTTAVAKQVKHIVGSFLTPEDQTQIHKLVSSMRHHEAEHTSIDASLHECIKDGVAFHHAGLSSYQRKIVEQSFKQRLIKCIVATPTLAAGVNIPAQRVIIRDLWRYDPNYGMKPIPVLEYKQQAGRAGRPRYDSLGEAITIAKDEGTKEKILTLYIHADAEPIYSKLGSEAALRMHILAAIATGFVTTNEELKSFIDRTFYAQQTEVYFLEDKLQQTIDFMMHHGFIEGSDTMYTPTLFGKRTSSLYVDPMSAVLIKKALENTEDIQCSELSLLHIACSTPDVRSLYMRRGDTWVEEMLDIYKDELLVDVPVPSNEEYEWFLSDMKTAMLVNGWINEAAEEDLIQRFNVGPGDIHGIVDTTKWILHATREFARMYAFHLVPFISEVLLRVENGCKKELLNLISLKGIGRIRSRALFNEGFKTINELRGVPITRLAEVKTIGPRIAESIKKQINELPSDETTLTEYDKKG